MKLSSVVIICFILACVVVISRPSSAQVFQNTSVSPISGRIYEYVPYGAPVPADGAAYIWYDANRDNQVDVEGEQGGELETVAVKDGWYVSHSLYSEGLPILIQTHTDNDYVQQVTQNVGVAGFDANGSHMQTAILVYPRDPNITGRLNDRHGNDLLAGSHNITGAPYGPFNLDVGIYCHDGYFMGQNAYFDLGNSLKVEDWGVVIASTVPLALNEAYLYDYQGPSWVCYYLSLPVQRATSGILERYEIAGIGPNATLYIAVVDGLKIVSGMPVWPTAVPMFTLNGCNWTSLCSKIPVIWQPVKVRWVGGGEYFSSGNPNMGDDYIGFPPDWDWLWQDGGFTEVGLAVVVQLAIILVISPRRVRRLLFGTRFFGTRVYHPIRAEDMVGTGTRHEEVLAKRRHLPKDDGLGPAVGIGSLFGEVPVEIVSSVPVAPIEVQPILSLRCQTCGASLSDLKALQDSPYGGMWQCKACGGINLVRDPK